MKNKINLVLKGIAMGFAEVIPGVSGGTIAFITGIYERLLNAIKEIDLKALKMFFKGEFLLFWKKIDGSFLLTLFSGMVLGLLSGVFIITYLIKNHIEPLWGFFFGLILASVLFIGKQVRNWNISKVLLLILGIAIAYFLVAMHPLQGSRAYWYVFISGLIAISALIMPGISGSFMLLILGMYTVIIPEVKNLLINKELNSLIIIIVFGFGMLTGLFTFARVMSWAFKNYHQKTLVLLTGFMIGSLYKIWPWRLPELWLNKEDGNIYNSISEFISTPHDNIRIITERLVFPEDYTIGNPDTLIVLIAALIGFLSVLALERNQKV